MDIEGKDLIKQEMIKINKGMHGSKKIVCALCSVNVRSTFSNTFNMEILFYYFFVGMQNNFCGALIISIIFVHYN